MAGEWQDKSKGRAVAEAMAIRVGVVGLLVVAAYRIIGLRAAQVMIPVAIVLVVVAEVLLRRLLASWDAQMKADAPSPELWREATAKLRGWPPARAERRARKALADGESIPLITLAEGEPPARLADLAPGLRAFFGEWSEVAEDESSCLSWSLFGDSELRPGRIRIGDSGEDNGEYSVLPGGETVLYVERPYATGAAEVEESWPSIWHVVCLMAGCLQEIADKLELADSQS